MLFLPAKATEKRIDVHTGPPYSLTISGQDIYAYDISNYNLGYESASLF
jgi:hypothetical protein